MVVKIQHMFSVYKFRALPKLILHMDVINNRCDGITLFVRKHQLLHHPRTLHSAYIQVCFKSILEVKGFPEARTVNFILKMYL